jgi:hypothetical protein
MRGASAVLLAVALSACVPHPVGPARTYGKYEGKAVTTAESALSAVQSARLTATGATRHHLFGTYVGLVLGESEDNLSGLAGTFGSIQPPDEHADALRTELNSLLSDAGDHLAVLRIAARRGRIDELAALAEPLAADAEKLDGFVEAHR